jgi:zinc protease
MRSGGFQHISCAVLLAWLVSIQTARADAAEVTEYTLENGLRVFLAPEANAAGIVLVVRYNTGAAHDPQGYAGLAHLAEHLTFRGSKHLRPLQSFELIDQVGGGANGVTSAEHTNYYTYLPARALPLGLWIESERMAFALDAIDETALRLERKVVQNEYHEHTGSLAHYVRARHQVKLYGEDHPLAVTPEDAADQVSDISLRDVQWFLQSVYRPDNAAIAIVGKVDVVQARKMLADYFGPIKQHRVPQPSSRLTPPILCGTHRIEVGHAYGFGNTFSVTWPIPRPRTRAERMHFAALKYLLDTSLTQTLVKEQFMATGVDSSLTVYAAHALFSVEVTMIAPADTKQLEPKIIAAVDTLTRQPLQAPELQNLRTIMATAATFARKDLLRRAYSILDGEDTTHNAADARRLDAAGIQAAARLLTQRRLVVNSQPRRWVSQGTAITDEDNPCH